MRRKQQRVVIKRDVNEGIKRAQTFANNREIEKEDVMADKNAQDLEEDDDWEFETGARYFMGYFWWHYKKRGSLITTWWAFFGPQIKREYIIRFFF